MLTLLAAISGSGLINLLVQIIVIGLILWILTWVLSQIPIQEPFRKVANVIIVVIGAIFLINALLSLIGNPFIQF